MWGRRLQKNETGTPPGNTPTGVGKTYDALLDNGYNWKHPHGCGEDKRPSFGARLEVETPPRVWGRRVESGSFLSLSRNTPTGVGKTEIGEVKAGISGKHPHGCGEDPLPFTFWG